MFLQTPRLDEPEKRPTKRVNNALVSFSRVPPGKERESEILELAKMFGEVRRSQFSSDQVGLRPFLVISSNHLFLFAGKTMTGDNKRIIQGMYLQKVTK